VSPSSSANPSRIQLEEGPGRGHAFRVMSACFAYGLAAGSRSKLNSAARYGDVVAGTSRLIVVLVGGFTTNLSGA